MLDVKEIIIEPQPGPQTMFLSSPADIVIYGGAAGGGKSFGLLLESMRHIDNPNFGWVIFRRTYPEIKNEGGLWDESSKLFPLVGGVPKESTLEWEFPSGAKGKFAHMQYDKDKYSWQGAQIPFIGFDEVTHFSESMFFYMLSRNRSTCGVKPYIRATCNPDADSWIKKFIAPWVDENWPIEERAQSGELRWFIRDGGLIVWLKNGETHPDAKSVMFIEADIYDNPKLLEKDPGYLANLKALPLLDRERLLNKNWTIRPEGGKYFQKHWFPLLETLPDDIEAWARYWDFAASQEPQGQKTDPDYTASVLMGRRKEGVSPRYIVTDATWFRKSPGNTDAEVIKIAKRDDGCYEDAQRRLIHQRYIRIGAEEEGGASGKRNSYAIGTKLLEGFIFEPLRNSANKETRAKVASSQAQFGNIGLLRANWNEGFLEFLEAFPNPKVHDDLIDGLSGVMTMLFLTPLLPLQGVEPAVEEVRVPTMSEIMHQDPFDFAMNHGYFND